VLPGIPRRYVDRPGPEQLLGPRFNFHELRDIHEAIAGKTLQKDTFRRAMEPHLRGTGTLSCGTVGRPSPDPTSTIGTSAENWVSVGRPSNELGY